MRVCLALDEVWVSPDWSLSYPCVASLKGVPSARLAGEQGVAASQKTLPGLRGINASWGDGALFTR